MTKIIQTDCETPEELLAYVLALADSEEDQIEGRFDATLDAFIWFSLAVVAPHKAAQLLCRFNPQTAPGDWFRHPTDQTTPTEHQNLLRGFEDIGGERPLLDWMAEATARGWRYHPWADEYVKAVGADILRDRIREAPPMPYTAANSKDSKHENPRDRAARRLRWIRDNGGDYENRGGSWMVRGERGLLQQLADLEKAAGKAMSDRSDVRKDLIRAVESERDGNPS